MAPATTPPNFIFTSEETIGDLVRVASALEAAGHRPSLRFVRYNGNADGVAVEFDLKDQARSCGEMSVDAGEDLPDPAGLDAELAAPLRKMLGDARWAAVRQDTPVVWEGEVTTFGELSQNERMTLEFDESGQLVGSYPF